MSSLLGLVDRSSDPSPSPPTPMLTPKIEPGTEPSSYFHTRRPSPEPQDPPKPSISGFAPATSAYYQNTPSPHPLPASSARDGDRNSDSQSQFNHLPAFLRSEISQQLQRNEDDSVLDSESDAIVSVPEENSNPPSTDAAVAPPVVNRRPKQSRSSELVRITNMGPEAERNFREVVKKTRMLYDSLRIFLSMEEDEAQGIGSGRRHRVDMKAASVMRDRFLWLNRDKRIVGSIPGIQIGDIFFFRFELCVVGLHGQTQAGIDFLSGSQSSNGEPIATSIIVSGGYEDDDDQGDVIVYTGHGGQDKFGRQAEHQKLEGGNLAMEKSMHYGIEVRVIRGIKYENSVSSKVYVYDGLFRIVDCWLDSGKSGFGVFKFRLERIEGQPEMGSSTMKFAKTLRTNPLSVRPTGYHSFDISKRQEKVPVFLYNDIDIDREPLFYEYLAKTVFPPFIQVSNTSGCNCVSGCTAGCLCAVKNGGKFAYDYYGNLVRGRPVVFECGPSCNCPPGCRNRVTQMGLRNRLEVFRSRETGWGVRSLEVIHAGAFICEYAGVALTREQANIMSMNGDMLVYPARFNTVRCDAWGDLSQAFVDHEQRRPSYPLLPPLDFAMDVSKMRNVACYISHSTDPNVMVQFVLYDHNNLMFPRVMLFALENIPPMTELSLDYGIADEWRADEWSPKLALCN